MGGIRFETDGTVTIITGTLDYGQGHAAPFAQVLTRPARRAVRAHPPACRATATSSSPAAAPAARARSCTSGTAIVQASGKVIEQGKQIAAHVLEAAAADIEFARGRFVIAGTDRAIGIMELAEKLRAGLKLPDGVPRRSTSRTSPRRCPRPFPTAATSPRWRSIPTPASIEVVSYSVGQRLRHRGQPAARRRARCTAAWCRASARR